MKKRKLQEVKKVIKKLIKEQLTVQMGNTPLHKLPRICQSKVWQGIVDLGLKNAYCGVDDLGIATGGIRCSGNNAADMIFPVPTEITPAGRVGNEYCVCCDLKKIPDKKLR
tara:strand:+ start:217 stop:549 length:333 start_codon:yes stop_codon:yes gene_type:complete